MNSKIVNLYPNPSSPAVNLGESASTVNMKMLTVSSSVVQLTDGGYTFGQNTKYVTLDVQDNDVYVTYTGETPSASLGHILYAGNSYTWSVQTAKSAKFLRVGTTAGTDGVIGASQFTD